MTGNALTALSGPPPAPNAQPDQSSPQAPSMGAPALMGGQPGAASPGQAQAPAPSHQQTVAALRHFGAIEKELKGLLADPNLGRSDCKPQIIDGATRLVADQIMKPNEAVIQLGNVPEKPFDQKAWVEKQFVQTIQAANMVLDHHRAAFAGKGTSSAPYKSEDHPNAIGSLMSHYGGLKNG